MARPRLTSFMIKITSLAAFVGGPMYCCDLLKPKLGDPMNFIVCFLPLGLMLLATFAVLENQPTPGNRFVAGIGLVGAAGLVGMDAYAAIQLASGAHPYNFQMISFGIVAGLAAAFVYSLAAVRFITA